MTAFVKCQHPRPAGFVPIPYRDTWTVETTFGSSSSLMGGDDDLRPAPPPPPDDDPDPGPKTEPVPGDPEAEDHIDLGGEGG